MATADPPRYIDAKGTDFDVYFLDGSRITLKLVPATTAGQACVQIRNQLGLEYDADFSIYEFDEGYFNVVEDSTALAKIIQKWSSKDSKLYFKRRIFLSGNKTDQLVTAAKTIHNPQLRLRFLEDAYEFHSGNHRHATSTVIKIAALYLRALNPPGTELTITEIMTDMICPPFVLTDTENNDCNMGFMKGAMTRKEMAQMLQKEYDELDLDQLGAMKQFVRLSADAKGYGSEYMVAKRTKRSDEPSAQVQDTRDVIVGVGEVGLHLLDMAEPADVTVHSYEYITKWTVSRDGKIFAYCMDNDDVEYIVTDQASSIEKTVERYVSELVSQKSATGKDPRNAEDPLPEFVKFSPAPTPSYIADGVSHVLDIESLEGNAVAGAAAEEVKAGEEGEAGELPEGWVEAEEDGSPFYLHEATGLWQWTHPAEGITIELPEGWVEAEEDGRTFYLFEETGEWQYEHPALAVGGEEAEEEVEVGEGEEAVEEEAELPEGWTAYQDEEGNLFYEHEDGTVQYEFPEE